LNLYFGDVTEGKKMSQVLDDRLYQNLKAFISLNEKKIKRIPSDIVGLDSPSKRKIASQQEYPELDSGRPSSTREKELIKRFTGGYSRMSQVKTSAAMYGVPKKQPVTLDCTQLKANNSHLIQLTLPHPTPKNYHFKSYAGQ
jgi:hypothetical protein